MILCQPPLNGLPFIFSPPLLYKPLLSFIPRAHKKNPLSSLLLSSSEVEQSCHILVFLTLKVLSETHFLSPSSSFPPPLGPPSRVSSSTIWIVHEGIISFPTRRSSDLNHFQTNDLCSPFHPYLSKYFEFVNEVNFPRNQTSGALI